VNYWQLATNHVNEFCELLKSDPANGKSAVAKEFCARKAVSVTVPGSINSHFPDLSALERLTKEIDQLLSDPKTASAKVKDREQYEAELCSQTHQALKDLPYEILDDPKFWQYLAVKYFSVFIMWRETEALGSGNILTYFKATPSYAIPLRLYLRGQAVVEATGKYDLAAAIPQATDFWRSHILKVQTGRARRIVRTFAEMHRDKRMMTKQLRDFAKLINRMWANVYLYDYDLNSAKTILNELRKHSESNLRK